MCDLTRQIPLGNGLFALVDAEDYERISAFNWFANSGGSATLYAVRMSQTAGERIHISMHREVMSAQPGTLVDHKNHNGLDNRKINLRLCTKSQNSANQPPKTGRYKGVFPHRYGWMARIVVDKKPQYLGYFSAADDAAQAYNTAAQRLFGEFACLNVIGNGLVPQKGR